MEASVRNKEEKLLEVRAESLVPCVVYGHKQEPISLKIDNSLLLRTFRTAGMNHVVTLVIEGKEIEVLFHEIQREPVSGEFQHIDFLAFVKGEKVHAKIPLTFVWNSKAASEGAMIEETIKELDVKAEAKDLVDTIEIDLSKLEEAGQHISVSDVTAPKGITIENNENDVIVSAVKLRAIKEEADETTEESTK